MNSPEPQNYIIIFSATCLLIGFIVGFILSSTRNRSRINKAVEKSRKEAEAEKLEISRELNTQMVQVKESIIKTVEAYSSVARTIQEKLPVPPEFEKLDSKNNDALRLEVTPAAEEERVIQETETGSEKIDSQVSNIDSTYPDTPNPDSKDEDILSPGENVPDEDVVTDGKDSEDNITGKVSAHL